MLRAQLALLVCVSVAARLRRGAGAAHALRRSLRREQAVQPRHRVRNTSGAAADARGGGSARWRERWPPRIPPSMPTSGSVSSSPWGRGGAPGSFAPSYYSKGDGKDLHGELRISAPASRPAGASGGGCASASSCLALSNARPPGSESPAKRASCSRSRCPWAGSSGTDESRAWRWSRSPCVSASTSRASPTRKRSQSALRWSGLAARPSRIIARSAQASRWAGLARRCRRARNRPGCRRARDPARPARAGRRHCGARRPRRGLGCARRFRNAPLLRRGNPRSRPAGSWPGA